MECRHLSVYASSRMEQFMMQTILSFCYYQAHKVSEIAEYLGVSDSTYFRKQVLENLAENQYLERTKVSRAVYYKTNPKMVRIQ